MIIQRDVKDPPRSPDPILVPFPSHFHLRPRPLVPMDSLFHLHLQVVSVVLVVHPHQLPLLLLPLQLASVVSAPPILPILTQLHLRHLAVLVVVVVLSVPRVLEHLLTPP